MVESIQNAEISKVVDKLKEARDLIARPWGWVRGNFTRPTRAGMGYCALGAAEHVAGSSYGTFEQMHRCLMEAVREITGGEWSGVIGFNDSVRDKRRVLRLFDKAIEIAERKRVSND